MTLTSLEEANRYIHSFCTIHHFNQTLCFKLNLVVEELVSNLFKYTDAHTFTLSLHKHDSIDVLLEYPSKAFNFTITPPTHKEISHRQEGGLGLFLVASFTKTFHYRYQDGKSIYTLTL